MLKVCFKIFAVHVYISKLIIHLNCSSSRTLKSNRKLVTHSRKANHLL